MTKPLVVVRIGPYEYQAFKSADLTESGEFHAESGLIKLSSDLAPTQLQETLHHELLHGAFFASGLGKIIRDASQPVPEEWIIQTLSPVHLAMLQNNPDVVRMLGIA